VDVSSVPCHSLAEIIAAPVTKIAKINEISMMFRVSEFTVYTYI
jgi:hypothetical protein